MGLLLCLSQERKNTGLDRHFSSCRLTGQPRPETYSTDVPKHIWHLSYRRSTDRLEALGGVGWQAPACEDRSRA